MREGNSFLSDKIKGLFYRKEQMLMGGADVFGKKLPIK